MYLHYTCICIIQVKRFSVQMIAFPTFLIITISQQVFRVFVHGNYKGVCFFFKKRTQNETNRILKIVFLNRFKTTNKTRPF